MRVPSIRDLLLIVVVTALSRQVSARTYGLKNSLIQADTNHDFDFGFGDGTLLDDEDMQHDSSGNGEIIEEGSTDDGAKYLVKVTIISNEDLSSLSQSDLESYKNEVKYQVFHLLGADSSQYEVEVTDLSAFEHDVGRIVASMTLTLGVLVTPSDVFNQIYNALLIGRLGNLRVSADGFEFKPKEAEVEGGFVPTWGEPSCSSYEFQCRDRTCIADVHRCDGYVQCPDGSDEIDCERCGQSDFVCRDNRQCVPLSSRCDRKYDCSDGSDEEGCEIPTPCRANEFTCSNGQCIPEFNRCDGQYHCSDGSDETSCRPTCSSEDFQCGDGICVSLRQRCDGRVDCSDGTDELFCPTAPVGCSSEEFQCQNGRCIPTPYRCDGRPDCEDQSDELYCPTVPAGCTSEEFQCQNGRCIPTPYRCDGRPDCEDQSDELYCPTPSRPCYSNEFRCGDGTCIDDRYRCNSQYDCPDGSDEQGCAPVGCSDDEFQCQDRCIPISLRCNGRNDCQDGMDELFCPTLPSTCSRDEFRCYDGRCIPDYLRCNGRSECSDGSDELNCQTPAPTCDENFRFKCWDGTCIDKSQRCDKRYDCSDRSDEYQCELTASPAELRLRTGATASFVCLAKSPTNLRWFRRDSNSLPYNARADQTGRLTVSDVRLEDAGEYVCSDERGLYDASVVLAVEDIVGPSVLPTPRPGVCRAGESMCRNGQCIPINYVCDGDFDCSDKSDEENCAMRDTCEPNEFRCANSKCILQIWRCDGDNDCGENDQSDELGCDTNLTSTGCRANEFKCQDVPQCIPAGYHCDGQTDCQDHSDEKGCIPPSVPVRMISEKAGHQGDEIVLECEARGIPAPLIIWRLNWGFVGPAPRVTATMERVTPVTWGNEMVTVRGKLVIKDLRKEDEGAYSCEAINSRGSIFATPDTIVYLLPPKEVFCRPPMFNSEARNPAECLRCWCSELTNECTSSTLYNSLRRRDYDIQHGSLGFLRSPLKEVNVQSFSELFEPFLGNRLTSYGGYITYNVFYQGEPEPSNGLVAVVLTGANNVKLYSFHQDTPQPNVTTHVRIPLRENHWYLDALKYRPASRADLMEVLKDVKSAQVRFVFSQNQADVRIFDIYLSTTSDQDNMRGLANLVEICSCPQGYMGTSCEVCAPNYRRAPSGACESTCFCNGHSDTCDPEHGYCLNCLHNTMGWQCEHCADGYYRTAPGGECKVCPCPWIGNQPTLCKLNKDGEVQCHNCSEGSFGQDCQQCHKEYLLAGGVCIKLEPKVCNENGTARSEAVGGVTKCTCKKNVQSPDCSKCKPNSFNLRGDNPEGCDECFCWGATSTCNLAESYEWYSINSRFTDTGNLDEDTDEFAVTEKREIETEDFRLTTKHRPGFVTFFTGLKKPYNFLSWELPPKYLDNKLTSYGGFLNYTVLYETLNNERLTDWPDVVLSGKNGLTLHYRNPNFVEAGYPQKVSIPLREYGWTTEDNSPLSRAQFMSVLSDLNSLKIRARYTTYDTENSLSDVSLDYARESNTGRPKANFIEQCTCPPGYYGLSCERCQDDYKVKVESPVKRLCSKCDCHGHGVCNEEGFCPVCDHNTEGDQCQKCKAGFYGDATTRGQDACRPCPCPNANDVGRAATCEVDKQTKAVKCRTCPEGHTGERCERCLPGYEGNPWLEFCRRVSFVTPTAGPYQPVIDPVDPNPAVEAGRDLTLFCNARGAEPLTVQWVRGENQPLSERATQLPDGRLVIRNIRPEDAGVYICIARNNYASTELVVNVYVTGDPGVQLQIQPSHPEPIYGTDYSLLCSVKNAVNYVLTWTRDPMPLEGRTLTVENTLHFKTLTERDNGRYICTVYDSGRTYTQYYDLTVRGEPPVQPPEKRDVTAYVSQDVTLHCKVQSDYPTRLYWLRRGRTDLGPRAYVEDDNTLRIRGIQHEDEDTYICVAENVQGKKEHHINISVKDSVIVNFQDVYRTKVGDNVNLACEVAEGSRYVIYWVRNYGDPLGPRASQSTTGDLQNLLNIRGIQPEDAGNYTCVVRNQQGEETRAVAYIRVEADDRLPKIGPGPSFIPIPYGSTAVLSCVAQSPVAYTVFWYKDGADITYLKQADNSITLANFQQRDVGIYKCVVQNQYGQVQHEVNVTANANGNRSPQAYITHDYWKQGGRNNARLQCFASGEPSITWSRADGRPLSAKVRYEADNILVIPDLTPSDAGEYVCKALYHPYGDAQANFYLNGITHEDKPIFATGARLRYVKAGDTATFECHLGPDLDTSINPIIWFRRDRRRQDHRYTDDGEGQLVIHDVNPSDAGKIVCSVYITEDEADEDEFELIIEDDSSPDRTPSAIIGSPYETVAVEGQPVEIKCFVKGSPKPSIYWTHNGLPLYQYLTQDGNVYIQQAKQDDEGEYVCHARNQIGTASSRIFLNVQNSNYPVSVSAPPKIVERQDLTLSCRTDSYIKVEGIDWSKLKGRLPPGAEQTREESSSSLKIPECHKEDEGRYVCTIYFVDGGKEMAYYTFKLAHEDRIVETRSVYLEITPKSLDVEVGSTALLTCTVHNVGASLPAVSWSRPGLALPRSHRIDGPVLTLFDMDAEDGGTYLCSAQTEEGYKEAYSEINVKSRADSGVHGEDPVLVTNVAEVYGLDEGMPLQLECTYTKIDSHPNHVIRWISPTGQATPSANGFASLWIDRVDKSHEGRYTCHVQGEIGEFRKFVDLRVAEHRESSLISIYPPSLRIAVGQSSQLQCNAQGRDYQWFFQFGDTDSGWLPIGHIKNAEPVGNTLRFIDLTQRNSGSYKCITTVESEGRYLEVEATAHLEVLSPPVISIVPSSVHLRPGEYLRLECRADGSQPIVFQWSRDSLVPLPPHAVERQGVLEIQAVRESDAGKYFCSARNDIGTAENVAEVTVLSSPTVMVSPRTLIQEVGSTAEFKCQASGSPPPQIKWSKEIGNLPEQHSITTDSLILYNVQLQDKGNYICSAFNEAGQNRDLVFLEVTGGETNGQGIQTKYEQARLGDSVEINCEPSTDYPNIHWLKSNSDLPAKVVIDGSTLVIPSVEESDEGTYKCFATHESGVYYAQVILTVLVPPSMVEQHYVKTTSLGSAAQLVCEARGNPRPQFTWFRRNGEVPRKSQINDNILWIPNMEAEDFGQYVCQAQNDYGRAELVFQLESGHFIPYFIQNPLSYLTLPASRNNELSFSLSFNMRTLSMEGLVLLYGGPNLDEGFVSLGLEGSQLQATFFDGRQTHKVEGGVPRLEEWSEVEFKVGGDGATLRVDFETEVLTGSFNVLPYYNGLMYLGGVERSLTETVARYTGYRDGFNGCINMLSVDGRSVDIGSQAAESHSVKDCPVCNHDHCRNGGACYPANNQKAFECRCLSGHSGFYCETSVGLCTEGSCGAQGQCINQQCVCPLGLSGPGCSEGFEVDLYFTGKTFLGLPLYGARPDYFNVSLDFMVDPSTIQESIVFYVSEHPDGSGQFATLYFIPETTSTGYLVFAFRVNQVVHSVQSNRVRMGEDVKVNVLIRDTVFQFFVNEELQGQEAPEDLHRAELRLNTNFFVGGVDESFTDLCCGFGREAFFRGQINEVRVNESPFNLRLYPVRHSEFYLGERFEEGVLHTSCNVHCENGGTCYKNAVGLDECHCPLGFSGELCETRIVLRQSVEFSGEGFLEFSMEEYQHQHSKSVEFNLITTQRYGLVFWQSSQDSSTHVSMGLEDGKLVMKNMMLGRQFEIKSNVDVADGLKHHVYVTWGDGFVRLTVDGYDTVEKESNFSIHDAGHFFLGGVRDYAETRGSYRAGFEGCVSNLNFGNGAEGYPDEVSLSRMALDGKNAHVCSVDDSI